jgi:2'-5' RNA ligase
MRPLQYALVAYVTNPVGRFVEQLRRELSPEQAHLPAHLTVLPPRYLSGTEAEAIQSLERLCRDVEPFEVVMGPVETFIPTTPTVFIKVEHAGYKMRELHDRLNVNGLACPEQWPYMPHLTVVKMTTLEQARHAYHVSLERWASYSGPNRITVDQLTFVREGEQNHWVDLAPIPLGKPIPSDSRR